jgi:phage baseplate assembly protein W
MPGLSESTYLKFPFTVGSDGPQTSSRSAHVREQIEQVLYTSPKERVFRPEYGVGIRRLVFEPNNAVLRNITHKQLSASLSSALQGEVDPKTLEIKIDHEDNKLIIQISYMLAAINRKESQTFTVGGGGNG